MTADRYAWMSSALCAQSDPDAWTDTLPGGGSQAAKRICARCPVRPACEAHATHLEQHDGSSIRGIWGGHSTNQRRANRHNDDTKEAA